MFHVRTCRRAFLALLLLAVITRVWFGFEFTERQLGLERYPLREMRHFTLAAERILEGDLWLEGSLEDYRELIQIMGPEYFYGFNGRIPLAQAPLYQYMLAGVRLASPTSWDPVRWLQITLTLVIGLLTAYLARLLTHHDGVAALAFAFYAFHAPSLLYAGFLLRETVFTFLLLLWVVLLTRHSLRPRLSHALALGGVLALMHMCRTSLILCLPPLAIVLVVSREHWSARARDALAVAATFALVVSPLVIRNIACDTGLLHNDAFGPLSLIMGNHPTCDGIHEVWPTAEYAQAILRQSGPGTLSVLLHCVERFDTFWDFLWLLVLKAWGFINGYEPWNVIRFSVYSAIMDSLGALPLSSTLLMPMAILGALTSLPRWRRRWSIYVGLLVVLAPCLAIYSTSRFRVPAVPYLAVFAACGLLALRHGSRRRRVGLLGLLALFGLLAYPSAPNRDEPTAAYARLGNLYYGTGQLELAKGHLFDAIRAHRLTQAPPSGLSRFPASAEWQDYLKLHKQANELCEETHDSRGASWLRRNLARHLASAFPR